MRIKNNSMMLTTGVRQTTAPSQRHYFPPKDTQPASKETIGVEMDVVRGQAFAPSVCTVDGAIAGRYWRPLAQCADLVPVPAALVSQNHAGGVVTFPAQPALLISRSTLKGWAEGAGRRTGNVSDMKVGSYDLGLGVNAAAITLSPDPAQQAFYQAIVLQFSSGSTSTGGVLSVDVTGSLDDLETAFSMSSIRLRTSQSGIVSLAIFPFAKLNDQNYPRDIAVRGTLVTAGGAENALTGAIDFTIGVTSTPGAGTLQAFLVGPNDEIGGALFQALAQHSGFPAPDCGCY